MKPVSTSTGLLVLSATIAACFAASRFGREERAFAEAAVPSSPVSGGSMLATGNCEGEPLEWFSLNPRIVNTCTGIALGCQPFGSADINGDGTSELIDAVGVDVGGSIIQNGIPVTNSPIRFRSLTRQASGDGSITLQSRVIFDTNALATALHQRFPNALYAEILFLTQTSGWADVDGDGDLDLIASWLSFSGEANSRQQVWFENTGFQKSPAPNPYDLDRNGSVNTADLSLLLMEFTD